MRFLRIILVLVVVLTLGLAPIVAYGADDEGPSTGRKIWDTVWRFINFFILAYLVVRLGKKPIKDFLAQRSGEIGDRISQTEKLVEEAETEYNEAQARLSQIEDMISQVKTLALEEAGRAKDRIIEDARKNSDHIMNDARELAQTRLKRARDDVKAELVQLALDEAEKLIRTQIIKQDQDRIIGSYLDNLSDAKTA